jgi:hypothetical protein
MPTKYRIKKLKKRPSPKGLYSHRERETERGTPRNTSLPEKLIVAYLVEKVLHLMKHGSTFPVFKASRTISPYPERVKWSPQHVSVFVSRSRSSTVIFLLWESRQLSRYSDGLDSPVARFFSSSQHRERPCGPPSLLSNRYRSTFPRGLRERGVKLTT